ncbi:murein L,D-transpeptidase catalytic domain-containing protein [Flavobacterium sp. S87F.05.LMB.W.Kidney.N]|uniref:murein L,D-transpeptidase catalytic domain-containing protein n=1 Tax=Flavobacterium sp. S87F.05.LMB.W.Kidney.N TaxID=1278758 RepID=UPI001065364A|nr:murein L,D-transpeptidase catalytic domain family protein [Flavobacterium sp. S87F.05.LMB.W.Kidney.N]TDX10208.1 L,D-transpeptidase-like protein [Flavobacterium sp. S87F.05.LMB.W.Kidney.N]
MKKIILICVFIFLAFVSFYLISNKRNEDLSAADAKRIECEVLKVKKLIDTSSRYNKNVAFFIDMKIPSGKNRFFVYDLKTNKVIDKGLVAHGSGSETGVKGKLRFSNVPNSLSTSLGRYSIGNKYVGKFGKAYRLYGLDTTNSNAFKRDIVFHYYYDVPYKEKDGYICNSYGCPMVNKKYFERISKIIDSSESDILMSIYY